MLTDLYMLHEYFEEPFTCLYADDLIARYGERAVADALRDGYLELRCLPCRKKGGPALCRLTERGFAQAAIAARHGATFIESSVYT